MYTFQLLQTQQQQWQERFNAQFHSSSSYTQPPQSSNGSYEMIPLSSRAPHSFNDVSQAVQMALDAELHSSEDEQMEAVDEVLLGLRTQVRAMQLMLTETLT